MDNKSNQRNSTLALAGLLCAAAIIGCGGKEGGTTLSEWSQYSVNAFANEAGVANTYFARTSSIDNASGVFSSPLTFKRATGTVHNGDSFYMGCRGEWKCWILEGTHLNAGAFAAPETLTLDVNGSVSLRLFNPDGSTKANYPHGRIHASFRKSAGQYLMSVHYEPATPDSNMPGATQICTDVALTGTSVSASFQ